MEKMCYRSPSVPSTKSILTGEMKTLNKYTSHKCLYVACMLLFGMNLGRMALAVGLDGTIVGRPSYVTGSSKFGKAIETNGSSGFVALPGGTTGPLSFAAGSSFTIVARIKTTSPGAGPFVIVGYSTKSLDHDIWLAVSSGKLEFNALSPNSLNFISGTHIINDGAWHTVALVANGSTATSYVDGVKDSTFTYAEYAGYTSSGTAFIGGWPDAQNCFQGDIDEVAVYRTGLAAKGTINPAAPVSISAPGLIALYHLDNSTTDSCSNVRPSEATTTTGSKLVSVDDNHIVTSPY